jgi:elongation factor Ts
MTEISAAMVKDLREKTGVGMMDCKKALAETKGDIQAAIDWLRKKGLAKAAGKADRIAAEGLVGVLTSGLVGSACEVNSETDFVARNDKFQDMVNKVTSLVAKADGDVAKILAMPYPGGKVTVDEHVKEMIATIGENMTVRRASTLKVADGVVAAYMHNKVADGLGKIGVLVALESKGDKAKLAELGRQIAMHVAARNPAALDLAGVPADLLAREKQILLDKNAGKPPQVLEKIAESGLKTWAKENTLLDQLFVLDESKSIATVLKDAEKTCGGPVALTAFVRFQLGDGIEKKVEDFAAEVAATAKG